MARPRRCRRICMEPEYNSFRPEGASDSDTVQLTVDEYEVIRLMDLERMTQEQCAKQMDIARTTVTGIYESARGKLADRIVNGKPLRIAGGQYRLCDGRASCCHKVDCIRADNQIAPTAMTPKGERTMRIAVTYENGEVFQHFGHTQQFKVYDVEDGKIVKSLIVDTNGQGHGALAGFLFGGGVDVLICGGIGGGARNALAQAGIQLYPGASGNADEQVKALLENTLEYDPNTMCQHHDHGEGHTCGEHGCGNHA